VSSRSSLRPQRCVTAFARVINRLPAISSRITPDANYPASAGQLKGLHDAAVALGLELHVLQASNESQLDQAFATLTNLRPDALVVSASAFVGAHRQQIIELAARNSLPAMYPNPDFPVALTYRTRFAKPACIPAAS
jgi:DNA-binding LacI/PurR family transcriptional regulator